MNEIVEELTNRAVTVTCAVTTPHSESRRLTMLLLEGVHTYSQKGASWNVAELSVKILIRVISHRDSESEAVDNDPSHCNTNAFTVIVNHRFVVVYL